VGASLHFLYGDHLIATLGATHTWSAGQPSQSSLNARSRFPSGRRRR
jgi:hypothetical protein